MDTDFKNRLNTLYSRILLVYKPKW